MYNNNVVPLKIKPHWHINSNWLNAMKARHKAFAMGVSPLQWTEKNHVNDKDHHTIYKV